MILLISAFSIFYSNEDNVCSFNETRNDSWSFLSFYYFMRIANVFVYKRYKWKVDPKSRISRWYREIPGEYFEVLYFVSFYYFCIFFVFSCIFSSSALQKPALPFTSYGIVSCPPLATFGLLASVLVKIPCRPFERTLCSCYIPFTLLADSITKPDYVKASHGYRDAQPQSAHRIASRSLAVFHEFAEPAILLEPHTSPNGAHTTAACIVSLIRTLQGRDCFRGPLNTRARTRNTRQGAERSKKKEQCVPLETPVVSS